MDNHDIFFIVSLGICVIIVLAVWVHNLVIDIRNKVTVKQVRKFFTENPKFCTYKTAYLVFDEKSVFYWRQCEKTKAAIDDLIKNRVYISSEKLLEYNKNIEELRKLLEIYSEDKERNIKREEEVRQQMFDYLKEKFPKLSSDKVEEKMWFYVNTKKEGE